MRNRTGLPHLTAMLLLGFVSTTAMPIAAQQREMKKIKVQTVPLRVPIKKAPSPAALQETTLDHDLAPSKAVALKTTAAAQAARPGKQNADQHRRLLLSSNLSLRKPATSASSIVTALSSPGISTVNGHGRGNFEPGGDYEILGRGFGSRNGAVFLRLAGKTVPLSITHWSDGQIFAHVPDDVSGQPDFPSIELDIGPAGQPVLKSTKFGFYAARADVPLSISDAMFSFDPGLVSAGHGLPALPTARAPDTKRFDGEYYLVSRETRDQGPDKRCVQPGTDRIKWNVPLAPGFEVTGYYWYHAAENAHKDGRVSFTPRGSYSADWDGDFLRINYGVMRIYKSGNVGTALDIPGSRPDGWCTSSYKVKLIVTGPRGLNPG